MRKVKLTSLNTIPSREYIEYLKENKDSEDAKLFLVIDEVDNKRQVKVGQHTRKEGGKIVPVKTYFSSRNISKGEGELTLSEMKRVEEVNDFINKKYKNKLDVNFTDKKISPEDELSNSKKFAGAIDMFGQRYTSVFGNTVSSIKVDSNYIDNLKDHKLKNAQSVSNEDSIIIKNGVNKSTPDSMYISKQIPNNCNEPDSIMIHELGHKLDKFLSIGIGKNKIRVGIGDFHFDGISITLSDIHNSFKMSNTEFVSEYSNSRSTPTFRNSERWADSFAASVYNNDKYKSKYTKKQEIYLDFLYSNNTIILAPNNNGQVLHMKDGDRIKYYNELKDFASGANIPSLLMEVNKKLRI